MKKPVVLGAVTIVVLAGGLAYITRESPNESTPASVSAAATQNAHRTIDSADSAADSRQAVDTSKASAAVIKSRVPDDPRLAALAVSPDNGLIEFVRAPDGKVIKEVDQDPSSYGYKRPLREYTYSGDKVIGLTAYRYFADHVEATKTAVAYKKDGSVDDMHESTDFDYGGKKK